MPERAALYVDGFNLYHAIRDLNEPHLKWVNLDKLGRLIIPGHDELVQVVYCTAFYPGDSEKKWRHRQYLNALEAVNTKCVIGHYIREEKSCRACGDAWDQPTEKEGDINVALHLFDDAWRDAYDHAYLLSADSDQAATVRKFRESFPTKSISTVAPPGRNFSVHILPHVHGKISITRDHIAKCLFPQVVLAANGKHGRRPREYDPPIRSPSLA